MQEADRRVDYDVAGEEHFFPAGTDMHRDMPWRVAGGVEGGHARRHIRSGLDQAQAVEHEHVCSPLFDAPDHSKNKPSALITEMIFCNMIDREHGLIPCW